MNTTPTDSPYRRSHRNAPRGRGGWGFQRSRTRTAYDYDRYGDIEFFTGTYAEARRQAMASMDDSPYTATMP